jgi:pimeloyl-ACP methyl ester carboxylesterase
MPRLQDTAYPRLKSVLTARDLAAAFTPTADELVLARRTANGPAAQLGFLVLLKLFQRLGRPVPLADASRPVVEHIARAASIVAASLTLEGYDRSGTRRRHLVVIRDYLGVQPYGRAAQHAMIRALAEAASTKYESTHDEAFTPAARAALRALYPQAQVRMFGGSGHAVMVTNPTEYVASVRSFLDGS